MKIRGLLLGSIAFAGLATMPFLVSPPTSAQYQQTAQNNGGTKQAPGERAVMPAVVERRSLAIRRATRRWLAWDGKNRTPGDRAHKRLKRRRRQGRA